MDEVFLKPNYQKNNNLCLADLQRTLKPKQMWDVLQISPSQPHAGAFSVPVKELRLGSQHQIRDSALALWQRGTFHEDPQWELSEACQHQALSSSSVRNVNVRATTTELRVWREPLWLLRFLLTEDSLWGSFAVTQPWLRCWAAFPDSHRLSWASVRLFAPPEGLFAPSAGLFAPKSLSFRTNLQDGSGYDWTDVVSSHQNLLSVFLIRS